MHKKIPVADLNCHNHIKNRKIDQKFKKQNNVPSKPTTQYLSTFFPTVPPQANIIYNDVSQILLS